MWMRRNAQESRRTSRTTSEEQKCARCVHLAQPLPQPFLSSVLSSGAFLSRISMVVASAFGGEGALLRSRMGGLGKRKKKAVGGDPPCELDLAERQRREGRRWEGGEEQVGEEEGKGCERGRRCGVRAALKRQAGYKGGVKMKWEQGEVTCTKRSNGNQREQLGSSRRNLFLKSPRFSGLAFRRRIVKRQDERDTQKVDTFASATPRFTLRFTLLVDVVENAYHRFRPHTHTPRRILSHPFFPPSPSLPLLLPHLSSFRRISRRASKASSSLWSYILHISQAGDEGTGRRSFSRVRDGGDVRKAPGKRTALGRAGGGSSDVGGATRWGGVRVERRRSGHCAAVSRAVSKMSRNVWRACRLGTSGRETRCVFGSMYFPPFSSLFPVFFPCSVNHLRAGTGLRGLCRFVLGLSHLEF